MSKIALITGAASKIGQHISKYLIECGFDLILHFNESKIKILEMQKTYKCNIVKCDFNNLKQVENKFLKLLKKNKIDLIINNASVYDISLIKDTTIKNLTKTFNVNFNSIFLITKLYQELNKSGHVINILDTRITKNKTKNPLYLLSKKLLFEFTKTAALEFAPDLRINAIAPGLLIKSEKDLDILVEKQPIKNIKIQEFLNAITFLNDNESITGQTIFIDGGQNL